MAPRTARSALGPKNLLRGLLTAGKPADNVEGNQISASQPTATGQEPAVVRPIPVPSHASQEPGQPSQSEFAPTIGHNSGQSLIVADPRAQAALDAVFIDSDTSNPIVLKRKQELVENYLHLRQSGAQERDSYIEQGRIFLQLSERLPLDEYRRFVSSKILVPVGENSAYKLRQTYERMARRQVQREAMPTTWTVAYLLMALPDDQFEQAVDAGLVRPDVTRAEIYDFKANLARMKPVRTGKPAEEIEKLRRRRDELVEQQKRLRAEMARLQKQLKLVTATLEAEEAT
jgi:hypothetical protein